MGDKHMRALLLALAALLVAVGIVVAYLNKAERTRRLERFDNPPMAVQESRRLDPCMGRPWQNARRLPERPWACQGLKGNANLNRYLSNRVPQEDARRDLANRAFRFVGRKDAKGGEVVIPGVECASPRVQNGLRNSACILWTETLCGNTAVFDAYAYAYNTTALREAKAANPTCEEADDHVSNQQKR